MTIFNSFRLAEEENKISQTSFFFPLHTDETLWKCILTIKFYHATATYSIMKFGRVFYERCQSEFAFGIHDKCDAPKANKCYAYTYTHIQSHSVTCTYQNRKNDIGGLHFFSQSK